MCQQQARSGTKACLFILVILVAVGTNTWECSNGDCIWYDWRCDGEVHCDGSDEQNCANWTCSPTWWKCANNKCIWGFDVCDGAFACDDGSDEINCENWACVSGLWKCGDESICISYHKRCDKHDHCADGSDEQNCGAPVVESLTLDGHNYTITVDGDDHITLNLTCRMFGRIQGHVAITKESNTFGNVTFRINEMHYQRLGTWTYEAVLTLSNVTCDDMGRYTCSVGKGIGGTDSKSIQLNVACCEDGTYGARCQESCGHCADDQTCNASTGHCLACTGGWLPPLCNQGCDYGTYGAHCQESCGHCADDQTCNASTGHCLACLDGWLPPLCSEEAPEDKTLSENEKIAIGVGVGVPTSAAVLASLYQVIQFLSNLGWMPFISFGKAKAYQKEETEEGGTEEGRTEEGGKEEEEGEVANDETERSIDAIPDEIYEAENETAEINTKQKFTKQYFTTARWLEDPYGDSKPASWHDFYSHDVDMNKGTQRSSEFTLNPEELVGSETEDTEKEDDR
ncbi:low-density lipoprotein receptor-related protein 2-like isoform X2 [Littorina saxatilis]|uniref:low-density lipoprotein receptor-related protein 2-like isoform X2 n=1 Tax=Littorina saxatilis TaxID=31220 RepID=UPI0038B43694